MTEITLYLLGTPDEGPLTDVVFDSEESAVRCAFDDRPWPVTVYEVTAHLDPATATEVRGFPEDEEGE